jgi:eukaryotic-like serine/threonine-protein kinase
VAISAGTRLGPYEILAPLGGGGMGEVWKARDTRLDRAVAIKVLPATLALDPAFRARFDREARTISQLSHPHICALYDVGESDGTNFLVLEYLEGETLGARLERGPLSAAEAVRIATEIADALTAAHRVGIVHRDLKPGNVFLIRSHAGPGGPPDAKLLDFGLAKTTPALAQGAPMDLMSMPPTVTTPLTAHGTILGTFHYMAPEQVEGRDADARSDVWAFGCVLYEMLTGTRAFTGKSHASLIANIMHVDPPPVASRQSLVSPALEHVLRRCLEKDPELRWQSIADVGREIRWAAAQASTGHAPARDARIRRRTAVWATAAAAIVAAAAAVAVMLWRPPAPPSGVPPMTLTMVAPPGLALTPFASSGAPHFALSPDGRQIAFVASAAGRPPSLWVRPLASRSAREIPDSSDASSPFWSSDGGALGFFANGRVKTIPLQGERPSTLAPLTLDAAGGAWSGDVILVGHRTGPITRMPASGGAMTPATVLRPMAGRRGVQIRGHRWPQFLPDGRHFIYTESSGSVMLGSLDSTSSEELLNTSSTAVYSPAGFLLFPSGSGSSKLMAQAIDPRSFKPIGAATEWLDSIRYAAGSGFPPVSAASGVLAYWDGTTVSTAPAWFDRQGNPLPALATPSQADHIVAIAPDGRQVAYTRSAAGASNVDIWLMDSDGTTSRFSFTAGGATEPIWSRDGREVLFTSFDKGKTALFRRPASGTERERLVGIIPDTEGSVLGNYRVTDWSADRRTALVSLPGATTGFEIAAFSFETGRATPLVHGTANEIQGRFSPDSRWIAYASNETGRWEVFVESFPPSGSRWQVSTDGGSQPIWLRDGRELFFLAPDRRLMGVPVTPGATFVRGVPRALFETQMLPTYPPYPVNYDVTSDGQRFLMDTVRPGTGPNISIVVSGIPAEGRK